MPDDEGAYERGIAAGEIAARLAEHDRHFNRINGSMDRLAEEMHQLVLGIQRLGDAAEADRARVITTAAALKDADQARRDRAEMHWSPMARLITAVMAVVAVAELAILIASYARN